MYIEISMLSFKRIVTQLNQLLAMFAVPVRSPARSLHRLSFENLESRALLAANPIGLDFPVNSFTTNSQRTASMAMDADGDFVVTWQSDAQDGNAYGIYAQRYNAAGVTQGVEFRVNSTTIDSQTNSAVAMDADGDFVVTWESNNQDGGGEGIYAQRFNSVGSPKGGEFRVNTTTTNHQTHPLSKNPNLYEVSGTEPLRFGFHFYLNIRVASYFGER